ncbi:MAG: hypothetical protein ACERIH_05085 [Labilibaculum antarcticum]
MYLTSFLAGFLSFLTLNMFLITLFLIIAFSNFRLTTKNDKKYIALLCFSITGLYTIFGFCLIDNIYDLWIFYNPKGLLELIIFALNLIFSLWLTGFFRISLFNLDKNRLLKSLMILNIAVVFTLLSFRSTGTIIGATLVSFSGSQNIISQVIPIIILSLGFVMPIGLILILLTRIIKKISEKKWWKIIQVIAGVIFITMSIIDYIK